MADFEVRAVYQYGDRFWENVWQIDIGSATDFPGAIITALKDFSVANLLNIYTLVKIVRRPVGSHDAFVESVYDLPGSRDVGASEPLPLFNTVRLLLQPFEGRPGVKFLRGLLVNTDLIGTGGLIASAVVAGVEGRYIDLAAAVVAAGAQIVVAADKPVGSAATQGVVQMRQLHRKRRKPVI